ncbi:MAG TPA: L,D-transpeptidase [Allosphingosinicella sp.]
MSRATSIRPLVFAALLAASTAQAGPATRQADFRSETASADARGTADWVTASGDNKGLPFMIVDKANAKVFLFDAEGRIRGSAPALLGIGRGDGSVPGIGQRRLATMSVAERTTPAGRFQASLGHDLEQDILWIDYDSALSLHRVIAGKPKERRLQRLASATSSDNRITYGCINVPVKFYENVVVPAFTGTVGIVYILPESGRPADFFPMTAAGAVSGT